MTRQRKTEIDAVWRDSRVWEFINSSSDEEKMKIFDSIEEYKGTALEIPSIAKDYELEQVAEKIGRALKSKSEYESYLKSLSPKELEAFYQTGLDHMIYVKVKNAL